MWHMGDGWGWWMVMGWVWMVAFWGLVIWAVYAIFTRPGNTDRQTPAPMPGPNALDILAQRYALGDLSAEEYEQMRERITQSRGNAPVVNGISKSSAGTSA